MGTASRASLSPFSGVWSSKAAQAPGSQAPSPCQQPPPHPQGPLPVPTSLFGFITLEGKGETFSFKPAWGEGSPLAPGAPGHPSMAHLLPQATPPAPPPSSHAYPPHPAGKEPSLPGLRPAREGAARQLRQAGGKAPGKEGPRGQRRGRCENEGEVQDSSQSRRWERGLWEAPGAGQVKGGEGESGSIGVQSPDAKKWRAKFPRGGGTWGEHSLH